MGQSVAPPKFINPHKRLFRYQMAAGLAVLSIAFAIIAIELQTEFYVDSKQLSRTPDRYDRIWFDKKETLIGVRQESSGLHIRRWPGKGSPEQKWDLPIGSPEHWAASDDLAYVTWIDGSMLHMQALSSGGEDFTAPLPSRKYPLALTLLSDGSAAVVFDDATVIRWNFATRSGPDEQKLPNLNKADQAQAAGDYVIVSAPETQTLAQYRFRDGQWTLAESIPAPDSPFALAIPAPGSMATIAAGHLRTGTQPRSSPGSVGSVASYKGVLLITGLFKNVIALSDHEAHRPPDDYEIAAAPPSSILAAGNDHLAYSSAQGTALLALSVKERLTAAGRYSISLSALAMLRAAMLVFGPFLLRLFGEFLKSLFHKKDKSKSSSLLPEQLPDPPQALVELLADGKGVLWAGAGLSAQSGVPVRRAFAASFFRTATVEKLLEAKLLDKLRIRLGQGEVEAAIEPLCDALSISKFASYADAIIPHFITPSHSHKLLAALPFTAAFTTNYDDLLNILRLPENTIPWNATCLTARGENIQRAANIPFLLKWYGNLSQFSTVVKTRPQLAAVAAESGASSLLQRMMLSRGLVFVGASLEGIKADLEALNVPQTPTGKHYAITGVSDPAWKALAIELAEQYGIEALVCDERNIAAELPDFLEKLVPQVSTKLKDSRPAGTAA